MIKAHRATLRRDGRKSPISRDVTSLSTNGFYGTTEQACLDLKRSGRLGVITKVTIEINGGEQVALNTPDECRGLFENDEIAVV